MKMKKKCGRFVAFSMCFLFSFSRLFWVSIFTLLLLLLVTNSESGCKNPNTVCANVISCVYVWVYALVHLVAVSVFFSFISYYILFFSFDICFTLESTAIDLSIFNVMNRANYLISFYLSRSLFFHVSFFSFLFEMLHGSFYFSLPEWIVARIFISLKISIKMITHK